MYVKRKFKIVYVLISKLLRYYIY